MSLSLISSSESVCQLAERLSEVLDNEQAEWLESASAKLTDQPELDLDQLTLLSARAGRKLGQSRLSDSTSVIAGGTVEVSIAGWDAKSAGRALLILHAATCFPQTRDRVVRTCYRFGDEGERSAITRALGLFPKAEEFLDIALETGRANSPPLFGSLAIGNPFPAAIFSVPQFNQMVLKVLFMGLPASGISGLEERANSELSRMCEDYFHERLAAGRSLPADGWLAMAPYASAAGEELLLSHLNHDDIAHRYYALLSTSRRARKHPELAHHIEARVSLEKDKSVLKLIHAFLAH